MQKRFYLLITLVILLVLFTSTASLMGFFTEITGKVTSCTPGQYCQCTMGQICTTTDSKTGICAAVQLSGIDTNPSTQCITTGSISKYSTNKYITWCQGTGGECDTDVSNGQFVIDGVCNVVGENAVCTLVEQDGDTSQEKCLSKSGVWLNLGSQYNCCGDDSQEYLITRQCNTGVCQSSTQDNTCYYQQNACVYSANISLSGSQMSSLLATQLGINRLSCVNGRWYDQGSSQESCRAPNKWIANNCCGDNTSEYSIKDLSGVYYCCNSSNMTIQNGACVQKSAVQSNLSKSLSFSYVPDITLSLNSNSTSLELKKYASDINKNFITFSIQENESSASFCTIQSSLLSCNPNKEGEYYVKIIAKTNYEEMSKQINIKVLPEIKKNSAPIALAGDDKTTVPNKDIILDASASYDPDNNIPESEIAYEDAPTYLWYTLDRTTNEQKEIGRSKIAKTSFPEEGVHKVYLRVTDSLGLSSQSSLKVFVTSKKVCKETNTTYFPPSTKCTKEWHSYEGEKININSEGYACDLFEVCSDKFDYILDDAMDCCDGTPIIYNEGEDLSKNVKQQACEFANKYSKGNAKRCQALYLIKGLGPSRIYLQGYFEAEMCCYGVEDLCGNKNYLYKPLPVPETSVELKGLRCSYDFNKILGIGSRVQQGKKGEWLSDSRIDRNNIALSDVPTHVSLNLLSTGTCADYSMALTTLLRKAGYEKDEIFTVEGVGHAYNLLKLPLDNKYRVIDTTGNNIGLDFSKAFPAARDKYDYCRSIRYCYNDYGKLTCPLMSDIVGCELVKESITQQTGKFFGKITDFGGDIASRFIKEATRT